MKAIIVGKSGPFRDVIATELVNHGYELTNSDARENIPDQHFDVCIDLSAKGIRDVKRIVTSLQDENTHYILVSTSRVYPPTPQISPWEPDRIDLCDDTGFGTVDMKVRQARAAERELKHLGSRAMPWTVLRPSIVEVKENPEADNMWWFVTRILDGGPIILPDDDDPVFRHVSDLDLARAIRVVAGNKNAYFHTVHVTGHALLSYESYARLIMQGLDKKVPIVRVAGARWKAAGLYLPMGEYLHSSFIDDSPLLEQLGWEPVDERAWIKEHAEYLVSNPLEKPEKRASELALLEQSSAESLEHAHRPEPDNWRFVGRPGEASSFHLESIPGEVEMPAPLLRTRQVVMGMADERFLVEQAPGKLPRVMGHNVLLELMEPMEPGKSGLQAGSFYLPVAQRPCDDSSCPHCVGFGPGVSGVTDEGFGTKFVSLPHQHLVPVPDELRNVSLLAQPLACLLSVIPSLLEECVEPVWVFGERIDALLAILLVKDAGNTLLHVNRTKMNTKNLSFDLESMPLQRAQKKVQNKAFEKPGMVINLSGSIDGENLLARALLDGGFLVTPFAATQTRKRRVNVKLPLVAPGRSWLEIALERLNVWSSKYELGVFLKPVELEQSYELFLGGQFSQSYVDLMEGGK